MTGGRADGLTTAMVAQVMTACSEDAMATVAMPLAVPVAVVLVLARSARCMKCTQTYV